MGRRQHHRTGTLEENKPVSPGNSAECRCDRKQKKKFVQAAYATEGCLRVLLSVPLEFRMGEWLDHKQHKHEDQPYAKHCRHPPEIRIGEAVPELHPIGHPEARYARNRYGDSNLCREMPFNAFEQHLCVSTDPIRSDERQNDQRHEAQSADPVNDGKNVQSPGDRDVIHHSRPHMTTVVPAIDGTSADALQRQPIASKIQQLNFFGKSGRELPKRHEVDLWNPDQSGHGQFHRPNDQRSKAATFHLDLAEFGEHQKVSPVRETLSNRLAGYKQSIGIEGASTRFPPAILRYCIELITRKIPEIHIAFGAIRSRLAVLDQAGKAHALVHHRLRRISQKSLEIRSLRIDDCGNGVAGVIEAHWWHPSDRA
nr:hypothetical protein [Rhizobium freirei]